MTQTIEECIDENTVNQSGVISDVFLGWGARASLLGREDLIIEGFAPITSRAKYFIINVGDRIGPDYHKEQLFVELYRNNTYYEVFATRLEKICSTYQRYICVKTSVNYAINNI